MEAVAMNARMKAVLSSVLAFSLCQANSGQTQAPKQAETPVSLKATEVALDVIVRDKKGKLVKGLSASDFQVLEDGVQQRIESFRFVTREATTTSEPTSTSTPTPPGAKTPPRSEVPAAERS